MPHFSFRKRSPTINGLSGQAAHAASADPSVADAAPAANDQATNVASDVPMDVPVPESDEERRTRRLRELTGEATQKLNFIKAYFGTCLNCKSPDHALMD